MSQVGKATEQFAARLVASAQALSLLVDKNRKDNEGMEDCERLKDEAGALWSLRNGLDGSLIQYWNQIAKNTLTAWDAHDAGFIRGLSLQSRPDPQRCATAIQWFAGAYTDFQARSHESQKVFFNSLKGFLPPGSDVTWHSCGADGGTVQ